MWVIIKNTNNYYFANRVYCVRRRGVFYIFFYAIRCFGRHSIFYVDECFYTRS